ncbi:hypothetical protein ACRYCC_40480 [Actinomadura scrupuli]|uniref:hypothetical protein n=1 Tax=Actinomadura scrupuli TaxID=559629 RepID=UPI003D9864B9
MTDSTHGTRLADDALRALDRLVGTWSISGDASGNVTYQWMDGEYFLIQSGEVELFGNRNRFTEIIGRERPFGAEPSAEIKSRTYTTEGDTLDYVYEIDRDTLTIWGGHRGSDMFFRGDFNAAGNILDGAWVWPGGGYTATSTRQDVA